jgi:hypothetical protein
MPKPASRIIFGLDPAARTAMALDMLRCVLPENASELFSVFIEDMDLLEHARSRLAREVSLSGAAGPLDSTALSRQMRAQSARARRELDSAAATLGIQHTFKFAPGNTLVELATQAGEADTLVVTMSETLGVRPAWKAALQKLLLARLRMLMFAREGWQRERNVAVVVDDPAGARLSMSVARKLCEASRSQLTLLVSRTRGEERAAEKSPAAASITRGEETVLDMPPGAIVSAVRHSRARAVIVPWHHAEEELALVETLLTETQSAVLLVGE